MRGLYNGRGAQRFSILAKNAAGPLPSACWRRNAVGERPVRRWNRALKDPTLSNPTS
jgi:hypothetical protein